MPKELTHWILAERCLDRLENGSRLKGLISSHGNAYLGGAVLPDTLLHLFSGPYAGIALDSARRFHDACDNSYAPLIQAESRFPGRFPDDIMACLLGVISHMVADMVFHPFVYALAGRGDMGRHYQLETDMDLYFIHKQGRAPARLVTDIVTSDSRETLLTVLGLLFVPDGQLPREALERALKLHCRFQSMYGSLFWQLMAMLLARLAGSPFREQRHLFYPVGMGGDSVPEYLSAVDRWDHPVTGDPVHSSVDELALLAVSRTVDIFNRIGESGRLSDALGRQPGANLLTGMHDAGKRDMKN